MTIPPTTILPIHDVSSMEDVQNYLQRLNVVLRKNYEEMAQAINGDIRRSVDSVGYQWAPVLVDTADTSITFTYDHQVGTVLRKGIITDVWFDIKWTAASGALTGNMYVSLPYKVAKSEEKPFVGQLQPSGITYTGGTECVINAIPDTYRGEIWNTGNGFTSANQASVTSGQIIGHVRYVAQGLERS